MATSKSKVRSKLPGTSRSGRSAAPPLTSLGRYAASVDARIEQLRRENFIERFLAKDSTLWSDDAAAGRAIRNRLGWVSTLSSMRADCGFLKAFADEVRLAGYTYALLLGMGGSSLCPEVCRTTYGVAPGFLDLAVLDSTDPAAVRNAEKRAPLDKTLFIVATKSGDTKETLSFYEYFHAKVQRRKGDRAGEQFVAITDLGSPLVALAAEKGFRRTFLNPGDIGGRYSALSYFGLLPAALIGVDIEALIDRAASLLPGSGAQGNNNPAIMLGATLGELNKQGRDKVTFVLSPEIASFGLWVEQLIAESTGKQGKGLFPVAGEPLGNPKSYEADRIFIHLRLAGSRDAETERAVAALAKAGQPVIGIELNDTLDLGREFFRWELAVATAASVIRINAFDEPNVKESKDNTQRLLAELTATPKPPAEKPALRGTGISLFGWVPTADGAPSSKRAKAKPEDRLRDTVIALLRQAAAGDYVAILAYLAPDPAIDKMLKKLRACLRDSLGIATSAGYGPRYLHSTGQFHKGGPPRGVFLEITAKNSGDLAIPNTPYTFGLLKEAQARGDAEALLSRHRPFLRVHFESNPEAGLKKLLQWVEKAFAPRR